MDCLCGYQFADISDFEKSVGYAVIPNENYIEFLQSEIKVLDAWTEEQKMKRLANSAALIGSMRRCPQCARLILNLPEEDRLEYYQREVQ